MRIFLLCYIRLTLFIETTSMLLASSHYPPHLEFVICFLVFLSYTQLEEEGGNPTYCDYNVKLFVQGNVLLCLDVNPMVGDCRIVSCGGI